MKTHNYKVVNSTGSYTNVEDAINTWAERGWRLVSIINATRPGYGYAHELVLERPVGVSHPDD